MLGSRNDLHIFDAGSVNGTRYCNEILLPYVRLFRGAMGLQFLFMDDNAPCHRTVAAEQLLESEDIERMDWPARSPDLNPIEHVWDFLGRRLAARTLPPVTIRELRLALQDEWAAMPQQLIDTLILSMGRRFETCLAVRGESYPLLKTRCFLLDTHHRDVSAVSRIALHATFSIKLLFIPLISFLSFGSDLGQRSRVEILSSVGRPPSHRVWEVYQPQTTDAYSLDFTDCPRVTDVYVKWLTWLDDWEMHRDEHVPWRMWVSNLGRGLWYNTCSARMKRLWPTGCPLTSRSSSIYKVSHPPLESFLCLKQHVCFESTSLFCSCQRVSSRGQAIAYCIVHYHDSQIWQRSRNPVHHRQSCRANFQVQIFSIQLPRKCLSSSGTPPVTQECARGIPALLREGQV
ncbi:transposable element Tcb2 transposase [Trichonephila clavipes]|nr:transposable element Tcb2 transposase [Trichonephila clavipes]